MRHTFSASPFSASGVRSTAAGFLPVAAGLLLGSCFHSSDSDSSDIEPGATSSAELVAALPGIAPYVVEDALEMRSGSNLEVLVEGARCAAVVDGGGAVLLATGLADDAGKGDLRRESTMRRELPRARSAPPAHF